MPTLGPVETWLPALNAALIVISGVFLVVGYIFIRRKQVTWHHRSMLVASVFAALFLIVYVTRAALLPTKFFPGQGLIRDIYFAILIPHTIVAALVAPFAFVTLRRALRGRYSAHRKVARITFPMWVFTAVTGWLVYYMLYQLG